MSFFSFARSSRSGLARSSAAVLVLASSLPGLAACNSGKVAEPAPSPKPAATSATAAAGGSSGAVDKAAADTAAAAKAAAEKAAAAPRREPVFRKVQAKPVAEVKPTPGDPTQGKFTLDDALKGLPGKGTSLIADVTTSAGKLECQLYSDKAP